MGLRDFFANTLEQDNREHFRAKWKVLSRELDALSPSSKKADGYADGVMDGWQLLAEVGGRSAYVTVLGPGTRGREISERGREIRSNLYQKMRVLENEITEMGMTVTQRQTKEGWVLGLMVLITWLDATTLSFGPASKKLATQIDTDFKKSIDRHGTQPL